MKSSALAVVVAVAALIEMPGSGQATQSARSPEARSPKPEAVQSIHAARRVRGLSRAEWLPATPEARGGQTRDRVAPNRNVVRQR